MPTDINDVDRLASLIKRKAALYDLIFRKLGMTVDVAPELLKAVVPLHVTLEDAQKHLYVGDRLLELFSEQTIKDAMAAAWVSGEMTANAEPFDAQEQEFFSTHYKRPVLDGELTLSIKVSAGVSKRQAPVERISPNSLDCGFVKIGMSASELKRLRGIDPAKTNGHLALECLRRGHALWNEEKLELKRAAPVGAGKLGYVRLFVGEDIFADAKALKSSLNLKTPIPVFRQFILAGLAECEKDISKRAAEAAS